MASPAAVVRQIRWEQKSYWRNPAAASFTFAFPLLFLVIFTALNGNDVVRVGGGRVKFAQYYVPAIVAFGLISACYTSLAFTLCLRRENGVLKRVRGTPLSPLTYLAGIFGNVIVVALILTVLTTVLGLVAYGITFPGRYLALVVTVAVGAFCFGALGVTVSTFVPNEDAAAAIINFVLFPLLFISGTFGRVDPGSALARVASFFPVAHLNEQMVAVFNPLRSGLGLRPGHLAVLAIWGIGATVVSVRRFQWEPRNR